MDKLDYDSKVVWIIGASSGIGKSLANELAKRGAILCLSARRQNELETLHKSLPRMGPHNNRDHKAYALDVMDLPSVISTAHAIQEEFGRIDSAIFLAAVYTPMALDELDLAETKQIIDINLLGAFHVVHALIPILKGQSHGQIALCASVAGYFGLPNGQPYSATKAAIINLAESLRVSLPDSVDVKLISPGFVRTALTDKNDFEMPMIILPEQAAKKIADGLFTNKFEIHFPKRFTLWIKLLALLPYTISLKIIKRLKR